MNYQLGSYVKFFNIIHDLENNNQIDNKQKQLLKINFTTKEKKLMDILSEQNEEDEEEIKFSLLHYLKDFSNNPQKTTVVRQLKRTRSSITEVAPLKSSGQINDEITEAHHASEIIHRLVQSNDPKINKILDGLRSILNEQTFTQSPSIRNIMTPTNDTLLDADLTQAYKKIKFQFTNYMKSHLLLMDETVSYNTIFGLLKELTKNLLNSDHFSFLIIQQNLIEIYQTMTDQIDSIQMTESLSSELEKIQQDQVTLIDNSTLKSILRCNSEYSYGLFTNDTLFIYHLQSEDQISILKIANDYQLIEEIKNLSIFLLETIQNAKVQFFSPLSIADMILDIGISFVRASKFLIIECMYDILTTVYKVEKFYSDQPESSIWDADSVNIIFKDFQITVCFKVYQMNLNKQQDQKIYSDVKQYYEKYLRFIRECFDKSAFYKFFLRSNDSLIFEFNKSGHLLFLSRPIPPQIKKNFNIKFNSHMIHTNQLSYNKIFDSSIVANIENYLQDQKWKVMKDNDGRQYEIFLKIEEKVYKGFAVIFTENTKGWVKEQMQTLEGWDNKIKAKIRKQLIQHETLNFVNKLKENNPDMNDSVASLYMPIYQRKTLTVQNVPRRKSVTQKVNLSNKSQIKLNEYCLRSNDSILDTFDFNILDKNLEEKHRMVWAILKKDGLIDDYQIPSDNLQSFIVEMEHHYNLNNNPYHNYDHGLTVMQTAHYFIYELMKTQHSFMDRFSIFILIISSLGHDVGHTGKTNLFEINSLSDLAVRYHDKSVLEQHHAALTIEILKNPQSNILINLSQEQFRNFRKGLISNILSTDMSEHFSLLKDFENRPQDFKDVKVLSGYIMHLSDFGGTGKKTNISIQWSARVNQEFGIQYTLEGELGYPQLPYMKDLHIPHIMAKSEIGFLKMIVRPCYQLMNEFLEHRLKHCIQNIDETIQYWEKIAKQ